MNQTSLNFGLEPQRCNDVKAVYLKPKKVGGDVNALLLVWLTRFTSICILRWVLKWDRRVRNMERESSKTSGTEETPFLDRATHRYCLMALMNISFVLKMGPAFCRMDRSSWSDSTFDRSSWDLRQRGERQFQTTFKKKQGSSLSVNPDK